MPETLTPEQAREQLGTARREAAEAAGLVEEFRERVRSGDDVTAEQIGAQKQLAELAELRVVAAQRKLSAAISADREARAGAIADRVRTLVDEDAAEPLIDAVQAVISSVRTLLGAAADRYETIHAVAVDGVRMNEELGQNDDDRWPSRAHGFMAQTHPTAAVTAVGVGRAEAVPARRLLAIALDQAIGGQGGVQREVARELAGTRAGLAYSAQLVPGLADALRDSEG